jgi:Ca2+-binding EF-hand superfamily protein
MTVKLFGSITAVVISIFFIDSVSVQAKPNSKGADSAIVVGTLTHVDSSGKAFDVQQTGESLRTLHLDPKSKVYFVGFPTKSKQEPQAGFGVKASCGKDGQINTITFTPPVGEPSTLGEKRLSMTEQELFNEVDKDGSKSISYPEFSTYIYYSPKHGPDSFRKTDQDGNGVLDATEFNTALSSVSWWKLSRMAADKWFEQSDENKDGTLSIKEFASICTSGNHIENIFKRADGDKSGGLTLSETEAYIRSVTHEEKKEKKSRKKRK